MQLDPLQVGDPNYGYRKQVFSFLTGPPVANTSSIQVLINADPVRPFSCHVAPALLALRLTLPGLPPVLHCTVLCVAAQGAPHMLHACCQARVRASHAPCCRATH